MGEEGCRKFDCDVTDDDNGVYDDEDSSMDGQEDDVRLSGRRAEEISAAEIQDTILRVLSKFPNQSCTLQSLTSRVLKELGVLTRGNPWVEFEKRVMRSVSAL